MTEVEKMEAGLEYRFTDRELGARRRRAIATVERYNAIDPLDFAEQERFVAEELFGSAGVGASVQQGFNCDNGRNTTWATTSSSTTAAPSWTWPRSPGATGS